MIYYYDTKRHLICEPYSIVNLHQMAENLKIKRCWFHNGKFPHYDIPLYKIEEVKLKAIKISQRQILKKILDGLEL